MSSLTTITLTATTNTGTTFTATITADDTTLGAVFGARSNAAAAVEAIAEALTNDGLIHVPGGCDCTDEECPTAGHEDDDEDEDGEEVEGGDE